MTEVKLNLKKVLIDPLDEDRKLRDPGELDMTMDELSKMTQKEAYDKSPVIMVGKLLGKLLTEGVQPKDVKQQSKLYRLGIKITEIMQKEKAEYVMDEEQLKELKDLLGDVKGQLARPKFLGQIYDMLETLTDEIASKKKDKDK